MRVAIEKLMRQNPIRAGSVLTRGRRGNVDGEPAALVPRVSIPQAEDHNAACEREATVPMKSPILTFRGVRGSMPVSGLHTIRYGGNTMCLDIVADAHSRLLIDGGTGVTDLFQDGSCRGVTDYHVLLTHYHWDHIQGFPFFRPLFDPANTFTFYGHEWDGMSVQDAFENALRPPWFPVPIHETAAQKRYVTVGAGEFGIAGLRILAAPLRHPQGVTAYRITGPTRSLVVATDCERGDPVADATFRSLADGVDVLAHDAQYTPEEYETRYSGWGHSTWAQAAEAAREAGVGQLLLVSHDPERTDDDIDEFVASARSIFPETGAAFEGMQIAL
jgi:phosphoribosyl 1,2-cyclic phosphodiesterase